MKIKSIRTVALPDVKREPKAKPRRESWWSHGPVANPMTRYPRYSAFRPSWLPALPGFGCVVEAEDGTLGFAVGNSGRPAASLIEQHLGPRLCGEPVMATGKIYDMAVRLCAPFGAAGIASFAISAIDLALWDLKGKLLGRPVYELIGGPARDELFCYATGNDTDWHLELGFKATKLACPCGPADGIDGLRKNVELVQNRRELIGEDAELMLDCWLAFDVEYTVQLAEALRPYRLKWMEECLPAEDFDAHAAARQRLPWATLATGEHWFGTTTFQHAASRRLVDVLQPDINWVGGMTAMIKIAAIAEAAGLSLVPHAGGNTAYGQHACLGLPAISWAECFVATPPGVPLEEVATPGVPVPNGGRLRPSDAPGFGVDIDAATLPPFEA